MMDSRIGLDFIVETPEYIGKLAAALVTNTTIVKKQVFELLSALCVYNEDGHARALDTLDHYKKLKGERYRFSVIVNELDRATAVDYQTALVAFINCLIISTSRLTDRIRLRNEFIGCHLLPVLNHLRKSAEAAPELAIQLDVFDEQRDADDAQSMQGPHGVDLNSPLDVFYAILRQVAETPQEIPFLSILQHLLRIDPKEAVSDIIWDTAERLVHRATLLENREDAARLLRAPSVQAKLFCHCQHRSESSPSRKASLITTPTSPVSAPPIPPPMMMPPPPPPPPPIEKSATNVPPPVPIPPPPLNKSSAPAPPSAEPDVVIEKLPQQEIPAPKIKMKTINWNKIPSNKVVGKNNIWTQVAYSHQHSPMADMDWSEIEGLFCQQVNPTSSSNSSPRLGGRDGGESPLERRVRKDTSEITLLDGKRSLNVNIFLKQFRSTNEDIVELIREGAHDDIGAEKLKGLLKILPEVDELDMLKSFNGDYSKLGNAEKFLLQLTNLSNYKLRIEGMLLKEEFATNMSYLEPSINSMIVAAEDLMTNKPLQDVLYMVLIAGNFLNSGGYAGNAAGVKLTSLQKITDIRANKPNMNLIHYVALQAEKKDKNLTTFADNVTALEEASKTTVEQLNNEINALDVRIKKVKKQIEMPTTELEIKQQMTEFLQMAVREVGNLQKDMGVLEKVRKSLADFFCEDLNSFKLEECFRIFHSFYIKFRQAVAENARRRLQEEQANARRRQREELLANRRRQMGSLAGTPVSDSDFDTQIYDPRTGFPGKKVRKANGSYITSEDELSIAGSPALTRRRLGSFNGQNGDNSATGKEEKSPDITPNGSLRRRRSRVLSEEDEGNLMEFLRASGGNENNRERNNKSWGSLDRSWARRARGSGPRKRPALLNTDFSADRERPSSPSPSPIVESKPLLPTVEDEAKPKEWRQKIESWLQANESDQISEENRKQTRRQLSGTNRRSLEVDSESERSSTLDPLPEGKQVHSGQSTYHRVYPDWKPSATIDKTDVMGAMEAVEDAQPQVKDKSAWRKSNLNVANSTEETKSDMIRQRHTLPRTYMDSSSSPTTNDDEQKRKVLISALGERPASDKLTVYIRRPSDDVTPEKHGSNLGYVPKRLRDNQSTDQTISNKIEIDSDNIETPPATRRVFTPTPVDKREPLQPSPCRRMLNRSNRESPDEPEPPTSLGDGQFDRFSATRRTRRYKRSTEHASDVSSPELVAETHIVKPTTLQLETSTPVAIDGVEVDKETRLKAWQERLTKNPDVPEVCPTTTRPRTRHQTGINQEDVRKALNATPTSPPSMSSPVHIAKPLTRDDSVSSKKSKEHDNDEGFEETQSLMSESPSQGASSAGGNYEPDMVDASNMVISDYGKTKPQRASSLESKGTVDSTTSSETPPPTLATTTTSAQRKPSHLRTSARGVPNAANRTSPQSLVHRLSRASDKTPAPAPALDRNNPARHTIQDVARKSVIPRRSGSLRKTDSSATITPTNRRLDVERSNSRNSLVSSRSSLNSATSTSTVKRVPSKNGIGGALKPVQQQRVSPNSSVAASAAAAAASNKTPQQIAKPAAAAVKRMPSASGLLAASATSTRPPRPTSLSFMKPTTASSTKIHSPSVLPTRVHTSSFRTK